MLKTTAQGDHEKKVEDKYQLIQAFSRLNVLASVPRNSSCAGSSPLFVDSETLEISGFSVLEPWGGVDPDRVLQGILTLDVRGIPDKAVDVIREAVLLSNLGHLESSESFANVSQMGLPKHRSLEAGAWLL
eukprot:2069537-Amphidinium_carterae.1